MPEKLIPAELKYKILHQVMLYELYPNALAWLCSRLEGKTIAELKEVDREVQKLLEQKYKILEL